MISTCSYKGSEAIVRARSYLDGRIRKPTLVKAAKGFISGIILGPVLTGAYETALAAEPHFYSTEESIFHGIIYGEVLAFGAVCISLITQAAQSNQRLKVLIKTLQTTDLDPEAIKCLAESMRDGGLDAHSFLSSRLGGKLRRANEALFNSISNSLTDTGAFVEDKFCSQLKACLDEKERFGAFVKAQAAKMLLYPGALSLALGWLEESWAGALAGLVFGLGLAICSAGGNIWNKALGWREKLVPLQNSAQALAQLPDLPFIQTSLKTGLPELIDLLGLPEEVKKKLDELEIFAGRYYVLAHFKGGMGEVLKAYDAEQNRIVAVKILKPEFLGDIEIRKRFEHEVMALKKFEHPGIVKVFDCQLGTDVPYYVMEFLEGKSLQSTIKNEGAFKPWQSALLLLRIIDALSYAHSQGIIHRDIKPENIVLAPGENNAQRVVLVDFGIAKILKGFGTDAPTIFKTIAGTTMGTPAFMSPEQLQGLAVDLRADIYSLGITNFHLVTGDVPFKGTYNEVVLQQFHDPLPEIEALKGPELSDYYAVMKRASEKDPKDRFQTYEEFSAALIIAIKKETEYLTSRLFEAMLAEQMEKADELYREIVLIKANLTHLTAPESLGQGGGE